MRRRTIPLIAAFAFTVGLFSSASLTSAADLDAKAILAKAYAAAGGEKADNAKAATWKEEGTYYGMGDGIPFTSTNAMQPPDRFRVEIVGVFTMVTNGDKGWTRTGGATADMTKEQFDGQKDMFYAIHVSRIAPLVKEKGYEITLTGEEKVNDRSAYVLKVARDKHKDVTLSIDKENFVLLKSAHRVRSEENGGKEVDEEDFYGDFKEIDGQKQPMSINIHRDGKKFVEAKVSDYKTAEKLDEKLFEKP